MTINKIDGNLRACFTPKELATLIINDYSFKFFKAITNLDPRRKNTPIQSYLAGITQESKDYEYFVAIFDLHELFEKKCEMCFNLNNKFELRKSSISSIDDLCKYREDPPDVIIKYKNMYYEFELKRYRGVINVDSLYLFITDKIIKHYSGKTNYLILLQSQPGSVLSYKIFIKLHEKLKIDGKFPGYLGFTFNSNNKEMVMVRVFPELNQYKRPFRSGSEQFSQILNTE